MKALQLQSFGDPASAVRLVDVPDVGSPAPDEVVIALEASPITGSDLSVISGFYGVLPELPSIGGFEGVGRVVEVGRDITHLKVGDRTLIPPLQPTWVERVRTRADWLRPLPDADLHQLSMLGINPLTAYLMLTDVVPLKPGDWVIQNAANSPTGRAVITIAKSLGLHTVNVVRSPSAAAEIEPAGGDVTLIDGPDLPKRIAEATGQAAIPLSLDAVGDTASLNLMGALGTGGTHLVYAALARKPLQGSIPQIVFNDVTVRGFWLLTWFRTATAERLIPAYAELAALIASGDLSAPIAGTYTFEQYAEALEAATQRRGKVILTP